MWRVGYKRARVEIQMREKATAGSRREMSGRDGDGEKLMG